MRINEDSELRDARIRVETYRLKLIAVRAALEKGCSLTPAERAAVLKATRP